MHETTGDPGPLFYSLTEAGELSGCRLHEHDVRALVQRRGDEAGIGPLSPRGLYATFVDDLRGAYVYA